MLACKPGQIIILNGAPRSGKSSIARVVLDTFAGVWVNLGVDGFKQLTSQRYSPGIGLRPGGELAATLEPLVPVLYAAMYESIAAHSRMGVNVVVDVGHHDAYSVPRGILFESARRLRDLPVLFVGIRCPIEIIIERRQETWDPSRGLDEHICRWQREVHMPGIYDVEVDTSQLTPPECADTIRQRLESGPEPTAFKRLAEMHLKHGTAASGAPQ
ncbi:MAG: chloramphenicol phosphotransferase [Chloroflexota bacterium]|nr:chloramphenicol phosphotransferase [Chloroflexota bacterium]